MGERTKTFLIFMAAYAARMEEMIIQAGPGAFGDGNHPTTRGVLAAVASIDPDQFTPRIALDIGAGSGILSLAIAQRFACKVVAGELDRQAVDILRENFKTSGYGAALTALHADGFDHKQISDLAPYDLIMMNILAEPLLALAGEAARHLAPEGALILSGILVWQEVQIRDVYQQLGLELTARLQIEDWVTLLFQKPVA